MSDIALSCPSCGKVRTVSEFSDRANLLCKHCGGSFGPAEPPSPAAVAETPPRPGLHVARRQTQSNVGTPAAYGASPMTVSAPPSDGPRAPDPASRGPAGPQLRNERKLMNHAWFAAALFVILGAAMWYLRYRAGLPAAWLAWSAEYAWLVVLGIHVTIVLRAMTEGMFQGILCLLIPGYSFYYLFAVTDTFYSRAIVAALLIGIGQDAGIRLNEHVQTLTSHVHAWIQHGGGDIR